MSRGRSLSAKGRFQRSGGNGGLHCHDLPADAGATVHAMAIATSCGAAKSRLASASSVRTTLVQTSSGHESSWSDSTSHASSHAQWCSRSPPTHSAGPRRSAQTTKKDARRCAMVDSYGRSAEVMGQPERENCAGPQVHPEARRRAWRKACFQYVIRTRLTPGAP